MALLLKPHLSQPNPQTTLLDDARPMQLALQTFLVLICFLAATSLFGALGVLMS